MSKVTRASNKLSEAEIRIKIKNTKGFWKVQKWLVVLNALVDPRPAKEIALHTGLSEASVHKTISEYNRYGAKSVETPGRGGQRRCYMSAEQESRLLQPFFESASSGQIPTILEIKKAYENEVGQEVHKTTIYRLLKRQGWRKIIPRPCHPKANKEEQESFKKTSNARTFLRLCHCLSQSWRDDIADSSFREH